MSNGELPDGSMRESATVNGEMARRVEFNRFLDAVTDYAIYLLDPDGRVMTWNEGAARLKGYRADDIVGEHYSVLFPEEVIERGVPEQILRTAAETGRAEYDGWIVRLDGSRFSANVVVTPIRDDDGALLGYAEVTHDLTEQREREQELREAKAFVESIFDVQPDVLYVFDRNGILIAWNDRGNEVTGYSDAELAEMHLLKFIPKEDWEMIAEAVRTILEKGTTEVRESAIVTKTGDRISYEFTGAPITEDGHITRLTGIGRDISERKAQERELRRQHAELQRLNRLNALIREINKVLIDADTREAIESAVVDRFAAAEPYAFALVGEYDLALGRFTPRAWAGTDDVSSDGVLPPPAGRPPSDSPEAVALNTQSVQVLQDLPEEAAYDRWQADARKRGYRSVAVVPLVASERQYGVLCIYSLRRIGERERGLLGEFGHTVGHAINSLEARRLLYADAVAELEFHSSDSEHIFADLSQSARCRISLERIVPMTDKVHLYYVTVTGTSAAEVEAHAVDDPAIQDARLVSVHGGESVWEFKIYDATLTELLDDYGAKTLSAIADRGDVRLIAEVAADADIRRLVEGVRAKFPATELVSKREVDRPSQTRGEFRRRALANLTDKQRTALEAAYYAGYFDWPSRGSTAEELAATLGISRPTLQQHLRVAERKLLAAFFEDPVL